MIRITFSKPAVNLLAIFALILACDHGRNTFAATFQGIPGLLSATALSSNGEYVLGHGGKWSVKDGTTLLTGPNGIPFGSAVAGLGGGISNDGSVVAAPVSSGNEGGGTTGGIWIGNDFHLAYSLGGRKESEMYGVSGDGRFAVGVRRDLGSTIWNIEQPEPVPSTVGSGYSAAYDISDDGATILMAAAAGNVILKNGIDIGPLPSLTHRANKLSPDGVIASGVYGGLIYYPDGSSTNAPAGGFIYDASLDRQKEFAIGGATFVSVGGVSNNARVVGQRTPDALNSGAFYWDSGLSSAIDMKDYLMNQPGVASSLAGWSLTSANDISADGRTIVGTGINPQGQQQAWVADLTRQVVLNFGAAAPGNYEIVQGPQNKNILKFNKSLPQLGAATIPSLADQQQIVNAVQAIFDSSGIKNIEVTTDTVPDAIQVYFPVDSPVLASIKPYGHSVTDYANVFDGTKATPGINRFAAATTGDVLVFERAFNQPQKGGLEFVAETIAHEVGHALGLMHLDGDGGPGVTTEVMDYNDAPGDHEVFTNKVTGIVDYFTGRTSSITQNAAYHLRHYVDGIAEIALTTASTPVLPGDFDVYKPITVDGKNYRLSGSDVSLFDVQLFLSSPASGGDIYQLVATSDATTASAIEEMLSGLPLGFSLRLLASSIDGGAADVALSRYDDGIVQDTRIPLTGSPQHFALVKYSTIDQSYQLLGIGELSSVPEPSAVFLAGVCMMYTALIRTRRHSA